MGVTLTAEALTRAIDRIFNAVGAPAEEARLIAEHLVGANLRGHDSHGVIRTADYVRSVQQGIFQPGAPTTIVEEAPATAVIDGGWNFGIPVARRALDIAITKARVSGVAFVVGRRVGHIGRVGAYGEQAVEEGMLAMGGVNSPGGALVAAFGGSQRRTGTNPLMIAFPTADPHAPFVLDMATSVVAEGKLKVAVNQGMPVPAGWILDGDGQPSVDPRDFYGTGEVERRGALLPVGGAYSGYKGFGLNLAVEVLSGILSGAGVAGEGPRLTNGLWFMVLDVARFAPLDQFEAGVSRLVAEVTSPPYAAGHEEILIAGDPERRRMAERLRDGVPLDDATWRQIGEAAASLGVALADIEVRPADASG